MVSFSKLASTARPATPAQEVAPEPKEAEAVVIDEAPEVEASPAEPVSDVAVTTAGGDLVVFNPGAIAAAISSALEVASEGGGGQGMVFPTLRIDRGHTVPVKTKAFGEELFDCLPQGSKPIQGVFLGFRLELTSWPRLYDEASGGGDQPVWSAALGVNSAADFGLAVRATKNYQFKPKDGKLAFDSDAGGPGHVRPVFQILLYSPAVGGPIVAQTPMSYASLEESLKVIERNTSSEGQFDVSAMKLVIREKDISTPKFSWKIHWYDIERLTGDRATSDMEAFNDWRTSLDAADRQEILSWLAGEDRPLTDDLRAKLKACTTL